MKKLTRAIVVAAAMAATAAPVSAGGVGWTWSWLNACGGDAFETCMSGRITYSGGNSLTVLVQNVAPYDGDVFTAVGLFNLPGGLAPTIVANDLSGWSIDNYKGINGPLSPASYAISSDNGVNQGFGEDGVLHSFTFTFANFSQAQLMALQNVVGVGIHAQRGPEDCSAKVGVTSGGVENPFGGTTSVECVSVPEPSSMVLLATGILGLGVAATRRRDGLDLVDEDGNDVDA